ncbi:MAG TPA: HNH endonuclease signature motif containing protein [Mycobacterium sp.]|nr:HNH endonuclease signature motif containing protein [Mycobacterium sp.]
MRSNYQDALDACDVVAAELDKLDALDAEGLSSAQCREVLRRRAMLQRRLAAGDHGLINRLAACTSEELGGRVAHVLADDLRIYRRDAAQLVEVAADLGPRRTLIGEPLPAKLEHTAAAAVAGTIGGEHVKVIRDFLAQLPCWVDESSRVRAERDLADAAARHRPDELKRLADHLELCLNPDGTFSDEDRARRRGITLGRQGRDGMSRLSGYLTPEARAGLEPILAKLAAPGMCNPTDEVPTITGTPSQEAIDADTRSTGQRNHDALNALVRSVLMSGELGEHNGLPVSIIVTADLKDVQAKAGVARAGSTWLPMSDVIRMAGQAYHYLLLFDKAKPLELYKGRSTRLATAAQRLVLHAIDRGCSYPGCTVPGYGCQAHHATADWAAGGLTNINDLTLACGPHNRLVEEDGWTTRKREDGVTEWIPPAHLDFGKPRTNGYFHPERYLRDGQGSDDEDDEKP